MIRTVQDTAIDLLDFTDLGDALLREVQPPEMLVDGLIYSEGIHSIYSPGGTGKTILALWVTLQVIAKRLTVIYIDEENGTHHITELLKHMGADAELVREYLKYAPAPGMTRADIEKWRATIAHVNPDLVIFDSFADHLALDGLNENMSTDVTGWIKNFAQPVTDAGGAVTTLDHITKDAGGKGARGSTAKLAKVDVAWKLTLDRAFDRNNTGQITVTRDKDRKGAMPYSRTFQIGGDGAGKLTVSPDSIKAQPETKPLSGNHKIAYDALIDGASAKEWLLASGVAEGSFFRVARELCEAEHTRKDEAGNYHALSNDYHALSSPDMMPF